MLAYDNELVDRIDLDDAVAILDSDYAAAVSEAAFDALDYYGASERGIRLLALERLFVLGGWLSCDELDDLILEDQCYRGERPCNLRACTELALYIGRPSFSARLALAA